MHTDFRAAAAARASAAAAAPFNPYVKIEDRTVKLTPEVHSYFPHPLTYVNDYHCSDDENAAKCRQLLRSVKAAGMAGEPDNAYDENKRLRQVPTAATPTPTLNMTLTLTPILTPTPHRHHPH